MVMEERTTPPRPDPSGHGPWERILGLLEHQQASLAETVAQAGSLRSELEALAEYSGGGQAGVPDIEAITDLERGNDLVDKAVVLCSRELLCMMAPVGAQRTHAERLNRERFAREKGVSVRTIQQVSAGDGASGEELLDQLRRLGVKIRYSAVLPYWLVVPHDAMAVVSWPAPHGRETVLVRHAAVIQILNRSFEFWWDNALPLSAPASPEPKAARLPLNAQQVAVLRLWAQGRSDAAIAVELNISPRTLRRVIASLHYRLGADTRFQAALVASRVPGLLDLPEPADADLLA